MNFKLENKPKTQPIFCFILLGKGFSVFRKRKTPENKKEEKEKFVKFRYF